MNKAPAGPGSEAECGDAAAAGLRGRLLGASAARLVLQEVATMSEVLIEAYWMHNAETGPSLAPVCLMCLTYVASNVGPCKHSVRCLSPLACRYELI